MFDPAQRPPSMAHVLAHPFFASADVRHAPPSLAPSELNHAFLSHFQGNAGPRCLTVKYAIEAACPGARLWLDQDKIDKSEAGMLAGVTQSRVIVVMLTQCYFSRREPLLQPCCHPRCPGPAPSPAPQISCPQCPHRRSRLPATK